MPGPRATLPLFPLGTVLFPGLALPLHVFEPRYRTLVEHLLLLPEAERRFGVLAIREGREVGEDGVRALHPVGTVAQVQRIVPHPDGRFDVMTAGAERFRLHGLVPGTPYLQGDVELLPEPEQDGAEPRVLARAVGASFQRYVAALGRARGDQLEVEGLPEDPTTLSCVVAAAVDLDLADRQELLEQDGAGPRLRAELRVLGRETALLTALSAVPAPQLLRAALSLN